MINIIFLMQMERQDSSSATEDEAPQPPRPHKNTYEFNLERGRKVTISSNFDNGNISLVKQVAELHVRVSLWQYRLEAVSDSRGKGSIGRKTWFHFCASVPKGFKVRFTLENVTIYEAMYEEHCWPKPVRSWRNNRRNWAMPM